MTLWAVTGASGYIGSALARQLLASGHRVRGLARQTPVIDGAEVIVGDLGDRSALMRLVESCDVVVHLAAWAHREPRSQRERRQCRQTNVDGTQNIVAACVAALSRPFIIFVSSASVYGDRGLEIDENSAIAPRTYYGRTKAEAEGVVLEAIRNGSIRGAILRPAVVFGADAPGNISRLARMIRRGVVPLIGGGRAKKSILPIGMLVSAIEAVGASLDSINGMTYNVAGASMSVRTIAEIIAEASGVRARVLPIPRLAGIVAVAILKFPAPRLSHSLEVAMSSLTLSDERLRALPAFHWPHSVEAALRQSFRGADTFGVNDKPEGASNRN